MIKYALIHLVVCRNIDYTGVLEIMAKGRKLGKGWKILIILIVAVIIGIVALVFFVPGFSIFGRQFIRNNREVTETPIALNSAYEYNIVVKTKSFDIYIIESDDVTTANISWVDNKSGFASIVESSLSIVEQPKKIILDMIEPTGWLFGNGKIEVIVPTSVTTSLDLNTESGSIYVNKQKINGLAVDMGGGKLQWRAENRTTETVDGVEEIKTTPINEITVGSISIFSNNAAIDMQFDTITVDKTFNITSDNASLRFGTLFAKANINCRILNLTADKMVNNNAELVVLSQGGNIYIKEFVSDQSATITTQSSNIKIDKSTADVFVSTTSGDITMGESDANIVASTDGGRVYINKLQGTANITTSRGNITIDEYYNSAIIKTDRGNISLHSKSKPKTGIKTEIEQNKGNINIISEANQVVITSNAGSEIDCTIRNMATNDYIKHNILNTHGSTRMYVMVGRNPFRVRATGNVSGELGSSVIMSSSTEYIQYTPQNYTGIIGAQSSLNVEGGNVKFTGIYE